MFPSREHLHTKLVQVHIKLKNENSWYQNDKIIGCFQISFIYMISYVVEIDKNLLGKIMQQRDSNRFPQHMISWRIDRNSGKINTIMIWFHVKALRVWRRPTNCTAMRLMIPIFSSPEPLGSQGELIGYPWSRRPSVVRPSSS